MYMINEAKQVLKQEKTASYELWQPIGMEKEVRVETLADKIVYQWYKFDLLIKDYVIDLENTTQIEIDGVNYNPINGTVEIVK